MFRIESYITPIIWSYFSKYVKNFNSHDFQVSLWNGGAVFSNLELNLDVLDSELQIPLTFASGHIQELKITVPWRKITSEPIVLNVKSMELVLKNRDIEGELRIRKVNEEILPPKTVDPHRNDENSGYVRSLMMKIVSNVRVNFENVVIKYVESDIVFSVNVGEASMTAADENWKAAFLDRIAYSPEFLLRKKLSFSDVNICLDRCNNTGLIDKFHDPMLYRCDFDVRIIQKFATSFSRTPYFYRMDLFLGHLQFCVTDEQIPMLVRLYNLFTYLMQSGSIEAYEDKSVPDSPSEEVFENGMEKDMESTKDELQSNTKEDDEQEVNSESWTSWATGWLFNLPVSVFGEITEEFDDPVAENDEVNEHLVKTPPATPTFPSVDPKVTEEFHLPPATTHFGVYIKTLTIIFKAVQKSCDRMPGVRRKIVNIFPFLKCSVQGICCDFILRGNENSHTLGVSSIMVNGLGFCPCGIHDCSSNEGGECYFEAGKIKQDFFAVSLFNPDEASQSEWCYDINHKECLNYEDESAILEKTPAFFLKYIVTRKDMIMNEKDRLRQTNPEITEILYHCVAAPCKVLLCSGLLHRLKMINNAINNYGYEPYGTESNMGSITRTWNDLKFPLTIYRLVIRQPLIEILAADHPSDYSPEKRAEFYRKNGGIITRTTLPRHSPTWPRVVISFDSLECTGKDMDGHFSQLRNKLIGDIQMDNSFNNQRQSNSRGEELTKWMSQKLAKTAEMKLRIMEILVSLVFEPVELNVGIKSGSMNLSFSNSIGLNSDICQSCVGYIGMESVTCSTRLEQRSNVLWLPFSVEMESMCDWEASKVIPTVSLRFDIGSLSLFVGPETLIVFLQLREKLSEYLNEFLPARAAAAPLCEIPNHAATHQMPTFADSFKNLICNQLKCDEMIYTQEVIKKTQIFKQDETLVWRYPQKRMIKTLIIEPMPLTYDIDDKGIKIELEYFEELTGRFHHFHSFTLFDKYGKTVHCCGDAHPLLVSTAWRLRLIRYPESTFLDLVKKSLVVESMFVPSCNIAMKLHEVALNLVNNTYYAGKDIDCAILQSYVNTDGVSPADHIMAALQMNKSTFRLTSINETLSCNFDAMLDVKVLDYESLMLETVTEKVFVGLEVIMPDSSGNQAMSLVTDEVYLKIGASLVHSLIYSLAMWTQVINSFDTKLYQMLPSENQTKIILNRVLLCNDLNDEIQIRSPFSHSPGADLIPSKDCKAVSLPFHNEGHNEKHKLYVSCKAETEFDVDVTKTGYATKDLGRTKAFVYVSNLSASQRIVKISGSLIFANGLDHAIELSLFSYAETSPFKAIIPSREVGPSYLLSIDEVEHVRYRITSGKSQSPWSNVVYLDDLKKSLTNGVSSVLLALYKLEDTSVTKIQIWLSLVTEAIQGSMRYLLVVSPTYCIRSWLCADTYVHITTGDGVTADMYSAKGKGEEVQIRFSGDGNVAHHMKFQSNLNVPPSTTSVPLLPSGPLLEKKTHGRPIDDLLSEISERAFPDQPSVVMKDQWPFVNEVIPKSEWNTEINPETEILVSFTPWIEGLPTAVADIRPWALFINLSGVELLFAQEKEENEWDQFWVPYKCVFSPKRIHIPSGKFRVGIMMDEFLVKSPSLQFTDVPERLSVKRINKDGKVPIDCYSRLDLFGGSQVACLTMETRVVNKILVVTVRPTYSIQNRAPFELYAEGITISSAVPQRRESWADARLSMYSTLSPASESSTPGGEAMDSAMPILHFTTDGQDYSASTPSYKYLALSCGGPWWFTQLVDCSETSYDNSSASGIPGTKMAVTLPKVDCTILNPLFRHKLKNLKMASEAVVVASYTSRGQVWVSISQDNAPQLMLHNKTKLPLFCVEKDQKRKLPRHATPCFEQYLMLPPKSSCHLSFINFYNNFPQLNKRDVSAPDLLLANVSQDLVDLVSSHHPQTLAAMIDRPRHLVSSKYRKSPSGNMLFTNFDMDWQELPNIMKNPTQYVKFGQQSVKISVEIVGYTYHVFIENIKIKEVSAKSVRSRFNLPKKPREGLPHSDASTLSSKADGKSTLTSGTTSPTSSKNLPQHDGSSEEEDDGLVHHVEEPPTGGSETMSNPSWRIKAFIPELCITMIDDFNCGHNSDREFLGFTFEPVIFELVPIIEDSKLRPAECPRRESWVYAVRSGSIQIDTPVVGGCRPCEFPVMMVPLNKNNKTEFEIPRSTFDITYFWNKFEFPSTLNFDCTITLTRVAPNEINLETVWLKVLPFSMFIEDRLISYVIPSLQNIVNVFNEGYVVLEKCSTVAASVRLSEMKEEPFPAKEVTHIKIEECSSVFPTSLFYSDQDIGISGGAPLGRNTDTEMQTLLPRNISFAPTPSSSSSGFNSSSSSVVSSSISNFRLASLSPPLPPSSTIPLEPHGFNSRFALSKTLFDHSRTNCPNDNENQEDSKTSLFVICPVQIPKEMVKLFQQLSHPVRIKAIEIQGCEIELTLRTEKLVYVALDRSVVQLRPFKAYTSVTTDFHLGLELVMHYTMGTIFTLGNPVRVLGSLELLGSPGTLARTVGTGLRDFVVYPYEGILNGPVGFASGLGYGMASLLRSVTSGTLVSLTNWAESVSRNIDRLTLDQQEQLISEAARQVELQGFSDGFVQGLSGFGIRILGAIGGLSHHPIHNVIHRGPTTSSVIGGVGRGMIGAVVKPIGGVAEFVSLTGQGILLATGWKQKPKVRKPRLKSTSSGKDEEHKK